MTGAYGQEPWTGLLPRMPAGLRVMLTAFLAIVGFGYLAAVANIYHTAHPADGRDGLSLNDLRALYSGVTVERGAALPSRMLTMIRTAMRGYATDADFAILETWLEAGGREEDLDGGEGRKTPRRAIIRNCLRCHAQSTETEISQRSPFGPDEFEVDYAMLAPLASAVTEGTGETVRVGPQYDVPRLVLVSHIHMLAIPMFTLAVGLLFAMTRLPTGIRTVLTPLPMIALVFDFAGWWLARVADVFVYVIASAGLVFGLVFGLQVIVLAVDLWRPGPAHGPRDTSRP